MTLISPALRPKIFHCNRKPIPPHGKGRLTAIRSPHTLSWMVELNNSRGEAQTKTTLHTCIQTGNSEWTKLVFSNTKEGLCGWQTCFLNHQWMLSQTPTKYVFSVRPPAAREGGRQAFNYANPNGNLQTTFQQKCPTAVAHSKAIYTPPSSKVVNRQSSFAIQTTSQQRCWTGQRATQVLYTPSSKSAESMCQLQQHRKQRSKRSKRRKSMPF